MVIVSVATEQYIHEKKQKPQIKHVLARNTTDCTNTEHS